MNSKNFAEYKQQDLIEFVNEALGGVVLEERGRIPFIEELMVEMEEKIFNQLNIEKEQSYSLDSFSYIPSKSSFFKKCVFWKGSKIRIDNKVLAPSIKAYIHPLEILYSEGILTIYVNILTNKEDMQFAFRSALSHELLYAYIQLQGGKRLPRLEMDKRRVLEMMHSEDIFCKNIGWFLYFEMPHAKDDYNERIQKTTKNNREIFGQGYSTYSFDEIKTEYCVLSAVIVIIQYCQKIVEER